MGRGKLSLNLIQNRKCRSSTFKKRKNNLMKKAYELSTLCEVPVCVLIHGGDDDQLHTWPPNRTDVQALLRACAKNPNLHKRKSFDLSDYFEDRRAKLLAETCKLREKHQFLCPNPNPNPNPNPTETYLHCLNESQLRVFMDSLDSKLEAASAMLELMESNQLLPILTPFSPQDDTPLLESPFVEDDPGLCFDDLQSLFPEHDHDHILKHLPQFDHHDYNLFMSGNDEEFEFGNIVLGNDEFDNNDLQHWLMPRNDEEFEFGNIMLGNDEFDNNDLQHLLMPRNDEEFEFGNIMLGNDEFDNNDLQHLLMRGNEFEFGTNVMMPGNDFFHW